MSSKKRLGTGIYEDASGVFIRISVQGKPVDFRKNTEGVRYKALYQTHGKAWMRDERIRRQAAATLKGEKRAAVASTFAADVRTYLTTLRGRTKDDAEHLLAHWKAFNDRARYTITALELQQHAATWRCAASTFNHRRQALISLYTTLDGATAPNPARAIPKRQESLGAPKALTYDVIGKVFTKMPPSQSRARLKVMAYIGLPQMQIQKLTPNDWQGAKLRVTPRRKGAGAAGRWLPLSDDAQAALKEFSAWKCWGPFSRSSLYKAWKRYAPAGTNPYSLRHSWITELYRRSNGDVLAVKQLALHARLDQTERYAAAALHDRMETLVSVGRIVAKRKKRRKQAR